MTSFRKDQIEKAKEALDVLSTQIKQLVTVINA